MAEAALAFGYNGLDDRVRQIRGSTTTRYVYDGDGRLIGEYGASATDVKAEYIWLSPEVANDNIWGGGDGIGDGPLVLYLVYSEGNFIECQRDCPYAQIGELKYGKPILDRALQWESPLDEAVKVGLISFDSTMRSNLSVGRPLDVIVIPNDRHASIVRRRIDQDDAYFNELSANWGRLMNEARQQIADPPFMAGKG